MLHVLLTILAVIGWILVGILGLVLFVVLVVLLSPISYRAGAEKEEELYARAKATYLFGIINAIAKFSEGHFSFQVKLFGKVIKGDGAKDDSEKEKSKQSDESEQAESIEQTENEETLGKSEEKTEESGEEDCNDDADKKKRFGKSGKTKENDESDETEETDKNLKEKVSGGFDRFTNTIDYLEKEENVRVIEKLLHNVGILLKEILPRYFGGDITIGTGDPCSTGKVMGAAAILYGRYGKSLHIYPNFEEKQLEFHLETKGHTTIFAILFVAAKVYFGRKNRRLLKEVKTIWGKN